MTTFAYSACSFNSIFALLLVVLRRVFSHHVTLEMRGSVALVVAVSTGKRLNGGVGRDLLKGVWIKGHDV